MSAACAAMNRTSCQVCCVIFAATYSLVARDERSGSCTTLISASAWSLVKPRSCNFVTIL